MTPEILCAVCDMYIPPEYMEGDTCKPCRKAETDRAYRESRRENEYMERNLLP